MTIAEMIERKNELGYSYEKIAELSGVPLGTVQKVLGGITKAPRYDTIHALAKVLQPEYSWRVSEAASVYGGRRQGTYTIEDYFALPDEQRAELIDGVFYDMATPSIIHQLVGGEIYTALSDYIKKKKGLCIPAMAPVGVQLDCDNKTMVEPDVLVVCDRNKLQKQVVYGAPDFVVEVLSPSTKKKDRTIKLNKYMSAGVREYWIVDSEKKHVIVYLADDEIGYTIDVYAFDDVIPVAIFDNECEINFKEIYEYIKFMYEK